MGDWFKRIFGFLEPASRTRAAANLWQGYRLTREQFEYDANTGKLRSKALPGREFLAGRFDLPSLADLRARARLEEARRALAGPLELAEVVGDVTALHAEEANRGALFQAASQFNTLEHTSENGLPEHGISCYAADRTQGPACATCCAPGTVVRNYFAFPDGGGQTKARQVQALEDVERELDNPRKGYFTVRSGYTLAGPQALRRLAKRLEEESALKEKLRASLRIGVQRDTEVVASGFGSRPYSGTPGEQLVTQCYCSAVSVSYSAGQPEDWEPFARLVLEAAYEATLYAAVENALRNPELRGSRKVFLTALGGGVFGNNMRWIQQAIQRALGEFEGVGLQVYLVSFGRSTPEFAELVRTSRM